MLDPSLQLICTGLSATHTVAETGFKKIVRFHLSLPASTLSGHSKEGEVDEEVLTVTENQPA